MESAMHVGLGWIVPLLAAKGWLASLGDRLGVYAMVALGIGFVIFIHELGHFLAAKAFGVKVEKFYVGFDVPIRIGPIKLPQRLARFRWGETEYGIGILPLGGYVYMLGQNDNPAEAEAEAEKTRIKVDDPNAPGGVAYKLDPRSFPAKPVLQRMVIISAGVVMNIISGLIMAAIAFVFGVRYEPAIIGSVRAGSPAWTSGLEPGNQVLSVGGNENDPQHTFQDMATEIVGVAMEGEGKAIAMNVLDGSEERRFEIAPTKLRFGADRRLRGGQLGIGTMSTNRLSDASEGDAIPGWPSNDLCRKYPAAEVVSVNDVSLLDSKGEPREDAGLLFDRAVFQQADRPVSLKIREALADGTQGAESSVEVLPKLRKTLGYRVAVSPITAIRVGSAAEQAGLREGDRIVAVDGKPVVDAIDLVFMLDRFSGDQVVLDVERAAIDPVSDTKETTKSSNAAQSGNAAAPGSTSPSSGSVVNQPVANVQVRKRETLTVKLGELVGTNAAGDRGEFLASYRLGVAWRVVAEVADVIGGDVADARVPASAKSVVSTPLAAGDRIASFAVHWPDQTVPKQYEHVSMFLEEAGSYTVDAENSMLNWEEIVQFLPDGTCVVVTFYRDEEVKQHVAIVETSAQPWLDRGIFLDPLRRIRVASDAKEALSLGTKETWKRSWQVIDFIWKLIRGKVSIKMIGGPATILKVASNQADRGVTTFLLFLCLLSANLAILNFLPIPALDGGHMLFLTAELITGKPTNERLQGILTFAGVLMLLSLMAFALFNDYFNLTAR
jgi:regulator of sigma E protease